MLHLKCHELRQSNQSRDFIKRDETEEQQNSISKTGTMLPQPLFHIRMVSDDIDGALKQLELDWIFRPSRPYTRENKGDDQGKDLNHQRSQNGFLIRN